MFGMTNGGFGAAAAYAKVERETGVTGADPHELIVMLFDGALLCVSAAKQHLQAGQIAPKGEQIGKAIEIIANGLKASLDMQAGGDLSSHLAALYDYMCDRLLYANLKNSPAALDEVHALLADLKDAWQQIGTPAGA